MKSNHLATLLLAVLTAAGCSPKTTTTVYTFDAKAKTLTGTSPEDLYLKENEIFSLKVINFNPFVDAFSITTTASTAYIDNTSPVTKFVTLGTQNGTTATAGGTAPIVGAKPVKGKQATSAQITELTRLVKEIDDSKGRLQRSIEYLGGFYNSLVILQTFVNEWKTRDITQTEVEAQFQTVRGALAGNVTSFYQTNDTFQDPFTNTLTLDANGTANIPNAMVVDFPAKAIVIYRAELSKLQQLLADLDHFAADQKAVIDDVYARHSPPLNQGLYKSQNSILLKEFEQFSNDYDTKIGNNLIELGATFSLVKNVKFEDTLGPLSMTKEDEMIVKIAQINTVTKVDKLKDFTGFTLVRRGFKIDFSAGLFGSGLHDQSFVASQFTRITMDSVVNDGEVSVEPNKTTFSKIEQRKGDKFSYGPMAFIHFYYKNSCPINFGAFIGTGLLFKDDTKPVLSFGGNALFGKNQRIVLGIGGGVSSLKRLSTKYQAGSAYAENITEVPTENHINVKWLVSLSWNVSK